MLRWIRHLYYRLTETPLEKEFREWTAKYLAEGEYISVSYFVHVLDKGKNKMAQDWVQRAEKRKQIERRGMSC